MNGYLVGIKCALEDYPIIGDDFEGLFDGREEEEPYRECLFLLLDVYKQWKDGKIHVKKLLWAMDKLCELLDY